MFNVYYATSIFLIFILVVFTFSLLVDQCKMDELSKFVNVQDGIPSIITDLRYAGSDNMVGRPFIGYVKANNKAILTRKAALALKKAQEIFNKNGYSIVIYDGYRPLKAVQYLLNWSLDKKDQKQKEYFYPRVEKEELFEKNYIALRSGHTRGSTVDLTIIKNGHALQPIQNVSRNFGGQEFWYLDDGTVDMGTSFDFFDPFSHFDCEFLNEEQRKNRKYLREVMESCGFRPINEEWWHFMLKDEPYAEVYWDFDIE